MRLLCAGIAFTIVSIPFTSRWRSFIIRLHCVHAKSRNHVKTLWNKAFSAFTRIHISPYYKYYSSQSFYIIITFILQSGYIALTQTSGCRGFSPKWFRGTLQEIYGYRRFPWTIGKQSWMLQGKHPNEQRSNNEMKGEKVNKVGKYTSYPSIAKKSTSVIKRHRRDWGWWDAYNICATTRNQ